MAYDQQSTDFIFTYLKAVNFFPRYAPGIKNWKHKLRGTDGNGKAIVFSFADLALIRKGVISMEIELLRKIGHIPSM